MTGATLGEVLLAQSRHEEAIQELERALVLAENRPESDDIRWDLAQAYICSSVAASLEERPAADARARRSRAVPLLDRIRENERFRELRPFTDGNLLDPSRVLWTCVRSFVIATVAPAALQFRLRPGGVAYESSSVCTYLGVSAEAWRALERVRGITLHVWGGGVNQRVSLRGRSRPTIFLSPTPRDTRGYYFAQLEAADGARISPVYPLTTFANAAPDKCPRNHLNLVFDAVDRR